MTRIQLLIVVLALSGCVGGEPAGGEGYGPGHNQGADCLSCHTSGGEADPHIWTLGGTVFSDAAGSAPVESVEVLIYTNTGTLDKTLITDYNGNFWTSDPVPSPYIAALTDGQDTVWMQTQPSNPSCAACHSAGSYVHFP